jgi:hypothetical protein
MEQELVSRQRTHLQQVIGWARGINKELQACLEQHPGKAHFRPSSRGVALVGLEPERPQRGKSGFRNLQELRRNFDSLYREHCVSCSHGRTTPEKQLQSFLIREAYLARRKLVSLNEASRSTDDPVDLTFVVDEIPVPVEGSRKMVCDLLAWRDLPSGAGRPMLIELKSARMMKELVRQVHGYADLVNRHADLFGELFSALLGQEISLTDPCEMWIIWPSVGQNRDPRTDELLSQGIRVVGYDIVGEGFKFKVSNGVRGHLDRNYT